MAINSPATRIKCADGFTISVQASEYHYCYPRVTGLGFYDSYELGFPSEADPLLMQYAEDPERPMNTVYAWVPAKVVAEVMAKHGGVVGPDPKTDWRKAK